MKELIYRHTCDCCHAQFECTNEKSSPLTELVIPMDKYDETSSYKGIGAVRVEACADCMKLIAKGISTAMKVCYSPRVGVMSDRKDGAKK